MLEPKNGKLLTSLDGATKSQGGNTTLKKKKVTIIYIQKYLHTLETIKILVAIFIDNKKGETC